MVKRGGQQRFKESRVGIVDGISGVFKNSRRTEETLPTGFASYVTGVTLKRCTNAFKVSALRGGNLISVGSVATFLL